MTTFGSASITFIALSYTVNVGFLSLIFIVAVTLAVQFVFDNGCSAYGTYVYSFLSSEPRIENIQTFSRRHRVFQLFLLETYISFSRDL